MTRSRSLLLVASGLCFCLAAPPAVGKVAMTKETVSNAGGSYIVKRPRDCVAGGDKFPVSLKFKRDKSKGDALTGVKLVKFKVLQSGAKKTDKKGPLYTANFKAPTGLDSFDVQMVIKPKLSPGIPKFTDKVVISIDACAVPPVASCCADGRPPGSANSAG